jgi:hypothetical protein
LNGIGVAYIYTSFIAKGIDLTPASPEELVILKQKVEKNLEVGEAKSQLTMKLSAEIKEIEVTEKIMSYMVSVLPCVRNQSKSRRRGWMQLKSAWISPK